MNRVVLVGRLTRDPNELRRSATTGTAAISFTLAVDNRSKQEDRNADFISCVAFNKAAEIVEQYFRKGMLVGVDGRLQSRSYEDKDGKRVYVTEVVCDNIQMLESKGSRENRPNDDNVYNQPVQETPRRASKPSTGIDIDEDELPF